VPIAPDHLVVDTQTPDTATTSVAESTITNSTSCDHVTASRDRVPSAPIHQIGSRAPYAPITTLSGYTSTNSSSSQPVNSNLEPRNCALCGESFIPGASNSLYHSYTCANRAKRQRRRLREKGETTVHHQESRYSRTVQSPTLEQEQKIFDAHLNDVNRKPTLIIFALPQIESRLPKGIKTIAISDFEIVVMLVHELEQLAKSDRTKTVRQHIADLTWL
jgi:hypothetical protein